MPQQRRNYSKGGKKYNRQKSGQVGDRLQFLRVNRKAIIDAGGDADKAMGLSTAAKTGKRVRELIREFPDFYYAPGKKKFIVDDANYDLVGFNMGYMPIRIRAETLQAQDPWSDILAQEWQKDVPIWYSFYTLFVALMTSSQGTGFHLPPNLQDTPMANPINFQQGSKQKEITSKAYQLYYDRVSRYVQDDDDRDEETGWRAVERVLSPYEFSSRSWTVSNVSLTALALQSANQRDGLEAVVFTNNQGQTGTTRFGVYTHAFNQDLRVARLDEYVARVYGIPGVVTETNQRGPMLETGSFIFGLLGPNQGRVQDAQLSGNNATVTNYKPVAYGLNDEDDQLMLQQSVIKTASWGSSFLNDDVQYFQKIPYNEILKVPQNSVDVQCLIVQTDGVQSTSNFFCCRRYPMTSILDAASGLLNSYNWYEQNGFTLTSDKLTVRLGPVKIPSKYAKETEIIPQIKMAKNMAFQYVPTMYFIDYDEALMADYKGKKYEQYATRYDDAKDKTIGFIKDHFIFLNPELYIIPAENIVKTAEVCLKIMDHIQKDDNRLIDGSTQTMDQRLTLVTDYITQQYGVGSKLGQHLIDFNKTTRTVKNAQFVKDIYCCFIPSSATLASHHQPSIKVQSNPVFMRSGQQNFLKMFNRTATVFYPTKPLMSGAYTPYDSKKTLASQLIRRVNTMTGSILREQVGQPMSAKFQEELVDGVWGLNSHQRPAVVSLSDVVLAKMYTQQMFPETAEVVHSHPMGAAAIRWSQFEVAFGLLTKQSQIPTVESRVMEPLRLFPSDEGHVYTTAQTLSRMVKFYNDSLENSAKNVYIGSSLEDLANSGAPSILAAERLRNQLVKTNLQYPIKNAKNLALLKLLETNTHTFTKDGDNVSFRKRAMGDDTLSDTRIQFSIAMNLLRKFFKALKVVQRYNGSSLMTVEGLMQATYSLPYKDNHQFLEPAFEGNSVAAGAAPSFGGVTSKPDPSPLGWKGKLGHITPFGEPVRSKVVFLMSEAQPVNGEPWEKATAAAQAYKSGRKDVQESDKYSSVTNTVTLEGLRSGNSGPATRMTIADQIGFLFVAFGPYPDKKRQVLSYMVKHLAEIRNMTSLLMMVYTTSTHKGISDFDMHRLIRQFVNYHNGTQKFFATLFTREDADASTITEPWSFDIPLPRKFEKYKRQKADDLLIAQQQALTIQQPVPAARAQLRNKYVGQAPVVQLLQAQVRNAQGFDAGNNENLNMDDL